MKAKDVLLSTFVLPLAFSLVSFTVPNRTKNAVKGPLLNTVTENLHSNAGREKANSVDIAKDKIQGNKYKNIEILKW